MQPIKALAAGLVASALASCAGMAEGTVDASRSILLTSEPTSARVTQGQRLVCETPCSVRQGQLRYAEPFDFTFPDGRILIVDPKMEANGAILGNIILGGGVGALMDAASGRLIVNGRHVHAEAPPPD